MDGYETYRKKHHDQIYRIMAHPTKPTCEYEGFMASGSFRRTKVRTYPYHATLVDPTPASGSR